VKEEKERKWERIETRMRNWKGGGRTKEEGEEVSKKRGRRTCIVIH